jgi:hypothetical protein
MMITRRDLLKSGAAAALPLQGTPRGKADACIFLWLGGGAAHMDTFDPKVRGDGKKKPGSYYDAIDTVVPGVRVCEHLSRTGAILDRCVLIRSLTHDIVTEHGAASNLVHTGRKPSGTILYPSIGSIVVNQLGPKTGDVPGYVVMGYPNIMRDPGFLGAKYGYVYLTQIETGPNGLVRPPDVDAARQDRRESLLERLRIGFVRQNGDDPAVQAQVDVSRQAFRLAAGRANFPECL